MGPTHSLEASAMNGITFPAGPWWSAYFAKGQSVEVTHTSEGAARAALDQLGTVSGFGPLLDVRPGRIHPNGSEPPKLQARMMGRTAVAVEQEPESEWTRTTSAEYPQRTVW